MPPDELRDLLAEGVGGPEPGQHPIRQLRALGGVAVEMSHAVPVQGKTVRLPHVVEERRKAQTLLPRHGVQGVEGVLPEVIAVVEVPLVVAQHRQKLRPEDPEDLREFPQHRRGPLRRQQLPDLGEDPLRCDGTEVLPGR